MYNRINKRYVRTIYWFMWVYSASPQFSVQGFVLKRPSSSFFLMVPVLDGIFHYEFDDVWHNLITYVLIKIRFINIFRTFYCTRPIVAIKIRWLLNFSEFIYLLHSFDFVLHGCFRKSIKMSISREHYIQVTFWDKKLSSN